MKNKHKIIRGFKAVKYMREVRDKISNDIKDMNFKQLKQYFEDRKSKLNNEKGLFKKEVSIETLE